MVGMPKGSLGLLSTSSEEPDYPLGSWSDGKFIFKSPAAEQQWRKDAVDSGAHFQAWTQGRKLTEQARQMLELGFAPSADTYRGPDGDYYQMTTAAIEDPHISAMRSAALKRTPVKADLGTALRQAIQQIKPEAMALMAKQSPIAEAEPANDNQASGAVANDNNRRAEGPLHLAQEIITVPPEEFLLPEEMTPLEELPEGSAGGPEAGQPFPRSKSEPRPCVYCSKPTEKKQGPNQYHKDHVIPRSQGGNNSPENKVDACRTCNLKKGPRTPRQWYKANGWIAQWLARMNKSTKLS
jgi:hypothetical protein